ncbi:MAG: hypothetical protein FWC27_04765 [Firmicutes bacterium]|nr:hypothetical protein [Bacillota bacterium]
MRKQILALAVALALLFPLCGTAFAAAPADDTPIVMVAGFTSTRLYADPGSAQRVRVWDDAMGGITGALLGELPRLLGGLALWMLTGRTGVAGEAFERAVRGVLGQFAMGPDGKPAHGVGPWPGTAEDFSCKAIWRDYPELGQLEAVCRAYAKQIGSGRVFVFQYDWRNSTLESVRQLREFIREVKALTDSETVRLFGESYGGQICAVYLSEYAEEGEVSKAVLEIPALGGTSILPSLLRNHEFYINAGDTVEMAFAYSWMEGAPDLGWLLKLLPQSLIAGLGSDLVTQGLLPNMITWGNVWDLIPAQAYEETKAAMLKQAGGRPVWEADSDRLHREIMPKLGADLQKAQEEYGVAVRIVACTGKLPVFGKQKINSDGLLDVSLSTGAAALPLGEHGLRQSGAVCADAGHRHLSPGEDIDASAAWLPENTWFVQGTFHGTGEQDPYLLGLETALMLDGELNGVFDKAAYPQFALSRHPGEGVYAQFEGGALRVGNLMRGQQVRVLSVRAEKSGLCFAPDKKTSLAPGESLLVPYSGAMPGGGYVQVTVKYRTAFLLGSVNLPVTKSKTFELSVS